MELSENEKYQIGELSIKIKQTILDNAKRDWRNSIIVKRKMQSILDDNIFDFMEENNIDIGVDTIDKIIENIILTAQKRF